MIAQPKCVKSLKKHKTQKSELMNFRYAVRPPTYIYK